MPASSAGAPAPVVVTGATSRDRGRDRGARLGTQIARTCADYAGLFAARGISADEAREAGLDSHSATRAFAPEVADEIEGIAEGARIDLWHLSIVIARTEILALSEGFTPSGAGECSTVAWVGEGRVLGAQTWDWHCEFQERWHVHEVGEAPGALAHCGLTEFGMPAKIGLNSGGVGCFINLLRHAQDAPGSVPIHAVLSAVLGRATTRQEALDIVTQARPGASSALTIIDGSGALLVEVSPAGVTSCEVAGFAVHTNHFLDGLHVQGAQDTGEASPRRYDLLRDRASQAPRVAEDLLDHLRGADEEPAVTGKPDSTLPFGMRMETLATVTMDPAAGLVAVGSGAPGDFRPQDMARLTPGGTRA